VDAKATEEPTAETLKTEAICPLEIVSHNPEGHNMNVQRRENHKFYNDVAVVEVCLIRSELCNLKTH
jgi:hypothetical protein